MDRGNQERRGQVNWWRGIRSWDGVNGSEGCGAGIEWASYRYELGAGVIAWSIRAE